MFSNILGGAAGFPVADLGDEISQSLRFKETGTLRRNLQTEFPGSFSATSTVSGWWKFANTITDSSARLIWRADNLGSKDRGMQIKGDGTIQLRGMQADGFPKDLTGRYRDPSAWYHIVQQSDGTNLKCWINNKLVYNDTTPWASGSNSFNENFDIICNNEANNEINYLLADFVFLDGTAADPDEFARTNEDGVWVPKIHSFTSDQYGANGFKLTFASDQHATASTAIGIDSAPTGGNHSSANNFTASNFVTTAISNNNFENDIDYKDTPTQSFAVGNTLQENAHTQTVLRGANLTWTNSAASQRMSTIPISNGKWYFEYHIDGATVSDEYPHLKLQGINGETTGALSIGPRFFFESGVTADWTSHNLNIGGNTTVRVTYDSSNGEVVVTSSGGNTFTRTWAAGDSGGAYADGEGVKAGIGFGINSGVAGVKVNFGQRDFVNAIPAGFSRLQTNNLPEPTIKNGSDHFRALTGTGANILAIAQGTNTSGTNWNPDVNTGFTNGLYWIKDRDNNSTQHQLVDTVRGTNATIKKCPGLVNTAAYSAPSGNSVAWCWNAPDAMNQATRESGNINVTTGRVNQDAGFSILEFTGNATNGQTVAHGLTAAPEFMIAIAQGNTNSIICWHGHAPSAPSNGVGLLNSDGGLSLSHVAAVSNQFITIQGNTAINDTNTMSMYLWHSVPGYSAFGSYNGGTSGSAGAPDLDGRFIYLGFRPAWLLIKRSNAAGDPWIVLDSTRDTHNFAFHALQPNNADDEISSGDQFAIDFLSNGFKCRSNNAAINNSSATYIYAAFAENSFGGENAAPATAR